MVGDTLSSISALRSHRPLCVLCREPGAIGIRRRSKIPGSTAHRAAQEGAASTQRVLCWLDYRSTHFCAIRPERVSHDSDSRRRGWAHREARTEAAMARRRVRQKRQGLRRSRLPPTCRASRSSSYVNVAMQKNVGLPIRFTAGRLPRLRESLTGARLLRTVSASRTAIPS